MEKQEKINIIKTHLHKIFDQESKKYSKIPNLFIFDKTTFLHYNSHLKGKFKFIKDNSILEKVSRILDTLDIENSFYFSSRSGETDGQNINIMIHDYYLGDDFDFYLYYAIVTMYHELRHVEQFDKIKDLSVLNSYITDYESFVILLEDLVWSTTFGNKFYHELYREIFADVYGDYKAFVYCINNGIKNYSNVAINELRLLTYDFDKILKSFNLLVYKLDWRSSKTSREIFSLSPKSTYGIFYDKNGNFKNISDILNNELFNNLDNKLKTEILTSRSFLSSIKYKIDEHHKNYIQKLINDKISQLINVYFKVRDYYTCDAISADDYTKYSLKILSHLENLVVFIVHNINNQYNRCEILAKILDTINTTTDYSVYKACKGYFNGFTEEGNFFDDELNKYIFIPDYFLKDGFDNSNYEDMLSSIILLKEAMKKIIDKTTEAIDAEYESINIEEKHINK